MSRVKGVVGKAIKVHIYDVVAGDRLDSLTDHFTLIKEVQRDGDKVRFMYDQEDYDGIQNSAWMTPELGQYVFLQDQHNERAEFEEA